MGDDRVQLIRRGALYFVAVELGTAASPRQSRHHAQGVLMWGGFGYRHFHGLDWRLSDCGMTQAGLGNGECGGHHAVHDDTLRPAWGERGADVEHGVQFHDLLVTRSSPARLRRLHQRKTHDDFSAVHGEFLVAGAGAVFQG